MKIYAVRSIHMGNISYIKPFYLTPQSAQQKKEELQGSLKRGKKLSILYQVEEIEVI